MKFDPGKIYIDSREQARIHKFIELAKKHTKFTVVVKNNMPVGDIVFRHLCIEFKGANDFIMSMQGQEDRSLFNQALNMQEHGFRERYVLVWHDKYMYSNNFKHLDAYGTHVHSIIGAVTSLITTYKTPVIILDSEDQILYCALNLINRHAKHFYYPMPIKKKIVPLRSAKHAQLKFLCSIPLVREKNAERLLKRFKNVKELANATKEEIMSIPNIGEKIANSVLNVLTSDFEEA